MNTIIHPPTPHRSIRLRFLHQASAQAHALGSVACGLTASILMLSSAGLSYLAEHASALGLSLHQRALARLSLCQPAAAAMYRARHEFYTRRERGVALD